jgi:hypothetical protein
VLLLRLRSQSGLEYRITSLELGSAEEEWETGAQVRNSEIWPEKEGRNAKEREMDVE